jgi:hypothetical protein
MLNGFLLGCPHLLIRTMENILGVALKNWIEASSQSYRYV